MSLPLQKAKYIARAVGAPTFAPASTGNMQICVPFEITQGDYTGETQSWLGTFTDNTSERIMESLMHMGWQGDDLSEFDGIDDARAMEMLPNEVELVCDVEPARTVGGRSYDARLRINWVNRIGGGRFVFDEETRLSGQSLKQFGAKMRSTAKSVRGSSGGRQATSSNGTRSSAPHPNAPGGRSDEPPPF